MEVFQIERKHAGFANELRLWVVLNECNNGIPEASFHLDTNGRRGSFSLMFADKALGAFVGAGRKGRALRVSRSE